MAAVASEPSSAASEALESVSGTEVIEVVAPILSQSDRVDKFLMNKTKFSRSVLQRLFEQGRILVNGKECKKNYKVRLSSLKRCIH